MSKNRVLGKGLSALIQGADLTGSPIPVADEASVRRIPLEEIGFNPDQPRKSFNNNTLDELANSIKQVGILQPVLVRRLQEGESVAQHPDSDADAESLAYCVVAGERRVRAARLAGLERVPALVCTYAETEALKVALLENIQREDLDPVEEAAAYRNLLDGYDATQEEVAEMLGKKRSTVANMLRILTLEQEVLDLLHERRIRRGHAKALLGMEPGPSRVQLARLCAGRGLSVREAEQRAQLAGRSPRRKRKTRKAAPEDPAVAALRRRAEEMYGSPVTVQRDAKTGKGTISLRFYDDDDFIRLLKIMGVDTEL
ncbi:MAG: ParB/RepB/Spo0J family partition protein [bacterium]|nr:ParB/RepB/Spo0J family partition protein [bacterium]